MKNHLRFALATSLFTLAVGSTISTVGLANESATAIRLSEPVEVTEFAETFGVPFPETQESITLPQLVDAGDDYLNKNVMVRTRVAKVCQKKGCFFIAQDGDTTMRVSFKDYSFFIPTDSDGKTVELIGVLTSKYVSKKESKHYAKDIGAPADKIASGKAYELIASSVRIPVN